MRAVRAPTVRPMRTAAATPITAWTGPGHELGAAERATTTIITPSSQAPALTGTQRPECGTVTRRTRHCRKPIASSAAVQAGTSTTSSTAGGATDDPMSAPPPMPTNHAIAAPTTVAHTQRRPSTPAA